MRFLMRAVSAVALICVVACGEDKCPAGTMTGIGVCKVPEAGKPAPRAGAGGNLDRPWPGSVDAGGGRGGSGGAGGSATDAGTEDADTSMSVGPECGNGIIEDGEVCDGNCPADCDTGNACLVGKLVGDDCGVSCSREMVTACASGDGCCPDSCTHSTDSDCSAFCGDGKVGDNETCDGDCPTRCDDDDSCTVDQLVGSPAMCNVQCVSTATTQPMSGDSCCPPGATEVTDSDCVPRCGNGIVEGDEVCDGNCPICDDENMCTINMQTGSRTNCDVRCSYANEEAGWVCGGGAGRCDDNGQCIVLRCNGDNCESNWYDGCIDDEGCFGLLGCEENRAICSVQCTEDSDCGASQTGIQGVCMANGWCEQSCDVNSDCPTAQQCMTLEGVKRCRPMQCIPNSPSDTVRCPSGYSCLEAPTVNVCIADRI